METRTILQLVLAAVIASVVGLGGFLIVELTRPADKKVVKEVVVAPSNTKEYVNPWSKEGKAAIALVKRVPITPPVFPDAQPANKSRHHRKKKDDTADQPVPQNVAEMLANDDFVKKVLKVHGKRVGWKAQWWGETKYGPSYFLVRYAFKDANILIGPTWLVDLKSRKVVPKNVRAKVVQNPKVGVASKYYDKGSQIVSAIANHRFDGGMSLAGALLVYFEQRTTQKGDTIQGWTIENDRGKLFKAYFQWIEHGEPTYALFDFDFDKKALKPVNLQAANIMRVGEEFDKERVSIMPASYDPKARPRNRWKGAARKQCRKRKNRARCNALATVLNESEVVESLEWLLTARSKGPDEFEKCKEARDCSWHPVGGDGGYRVKYVYKLGDDAERNVTWKVNPKSGKIEPTDRISKLAYSAIRPR